MGRSYQDVSSLADEPVITLYAGSTKTAFRIHQGLLCKASPVFTAAFLGYSFKEASEKCMTLPEESALTVERFAQWLYRGKFEHAPYADDTNTDQCYMQLAELYVLSDKYNVVLLHNHIIDVLFQIHEADVNPPDDSIIDFIYRNTSDGCAFRKLLIAQYVLHIDLDYYLKEDTLKFLKQTPDFSAELAVAFGQKKAGKYSSPFEYPKANYYKNFPTKREALKGEGIDRKPTDGSSETARHGDEGQYDAQKYKYA